ncbi:MAG: cation:proton antiporter [Candidatus Xenobia bacterium]
MVAQSVLIISVLLGIGFLATRLAKLMRLPHSVFLVLVGLLAGLVLTRTGHGLPGSFWSEFPGVVLYVLLPPLIFESAYHLNFADLKRDLVAVLALAVVALIVSCALVGVGLHAMVGIPYGAGLLFGALISATDPVAVVALFKEVGAPKRLSTLVEGESLINDGTAIVLFRVMAGIVFGATAEGNLLLNGAWQFVEVAAGGVLVGLVVVGIASLLLRATTEVGAAQLGLTVAFAYISFIVADHVFDVSGVMATMTVGMYLGNRARLELNSEALHSMQSVWEFIALSCNTLVFLAVGLAVNPETLLQAFSYLPATLLAVYLARAVSVVVTIFPLNLWPGLPRISKSYQAILVWGGLRGGLALALVFLMPESFPFKRLFLAMAGAVVLCSLLVNALTTAPLMARLGLNRLSRIEQQFYTLSLQEVLQRVFDRLSSAVGRGALSAQLVAELRGHSMSCLDGVQQRDVAARRYETQRMLLAEQQYYNRQLEDAILSPTAWQTLSRLVAQRLDRFQAGETDALATYAFDVQLRQPIWERWLHRPRRVEDLGVSFETLLHLDFALEEVGQEIDEHAEARALLHAWKHAARHQLEEFYRAVPHLGVAVQSQFVAHSVGASARHALQELAEASVISDAVLARAVGTVEEIHHDLVADSRRRLHPTLAELLASVPLFHSLPESGMELLVQSVQLRQYPPGSVIVQEDTEGATMFLVLSGILEVQGKIFTDPERRPRLFAGSFFGEMSLLFRTPRMATVVTLVDSQLAEIERPLFLELTARYPSVQEEMSRIARSRVQQNQAAVASTDMYAMLCGVPLFSEMPPLALVEISQRARRRHVVPEETIVQEGSEGTSFFLVLSGSVAVEGTAVPAGARLTTGAVFGEMSLLFGSPRNATIRAVEAVDLAEIDRDTFNDLMSRYPQLHRKVQEVAESRLSEV